MKNGSKQYQIRYYIKKVMTGGICLYINYIENSNDINLSLTCLVEKRSIYN